MITSQKGATLRGKLNVRNMVLDVFKYSAISFLPSLLSLLPPPLSPPFLPSFRSLPSLPPRYVPSQADVAIFVAVGTPPPAKFLHALRWFNHIASYSDHERLV